MIKLVLITGFLGAGKTTLMQSILDIYKDRKVGVIVNDFGAVNIDAILIKKDGIRITELSNGSIFCACIKDNFVSALIEMSAYDIDYLFIEASGLADSANMTNILGSIEARTKNKYDYKGAVCIIDAVTFLGLYEVLTALHHQVQYSAVTIINKSDLVDKRTIVEVSRMVTSINPETTIYITSYCIVDLKNLIENLRDGRIEAKESTNTDESRPKTFVLKSQSLLPYEGLTRFLKEIVDSTYRIKGFAQTSIGPIEVSAVGGHVSLKPWREPLNRTEIVVISSVGIKLISTITNEIEKNLKGKIHL